MLKNIKKVFVCSVLVCALLMSSLGAFVVSAEIVSPSAPADTGVIYAAVVGNDLQIRLAAGAGFNGFMSVRLDVNYGEGVTLGNPVINTGNGWDADPMATGISTAQGVLSFTAQGAGMAFITESGLIASIPLSNFTPGQDGIFRTSLDIEIDPSQTVTQGQPYDVDATSTSELVIEPPAIDFEEANMSIELGTTIAGRQRVVVKIEELPTGSKSVPVYLVVSVNAQGVESAMYAHVDPVVVGVDVEIETGLLAQPNAHVTAILVYDLDGSFGHGDNRVPGGQAFINAPAGQ